MLGWWDGGAIPGARTGTVVVVGHVSYDGRTGVLAALAGAQPGDAVRLRDGGTTLTYRVTAVRSYPKRDGIPAAAFARDGPARLVLITCGGRFDAAARSYDDNVVVYADPVP